MWVYYFDTSQTLMRPGPSDNFTSCYYTTWYQFWSLNRCLGFQEKDKEKVHLIDVNPEALKTLLDYAYTTEVVVHEGNVQDLLATSDLLQMTDVKNACCEFLKTQVRIANSNQSSTSTGLYYEIDKLVLSCHRQRIFCYFFYKSHRAVNHLRNHCM